MKISTGFPIFNSPSDPQGTENQSPNVIFNANSQSLTSHVIDVSETAIVVKAYGLVDGNTITIYTVSTSNLGTFTEPLIINGRTVQLAETSNTLVIDISGKYKFVLASDLGTVDCVYHDSGMSMFSFGLRAYAEVNANLEFVETATVLPAVSGIEVRENVKLSAVAGNLLQIQSDGLYYGIAPPPNFANQYVSSSTGNDSTGDGTIAHPWASITKAVSNLPDGTAGNIHLLAGDTFSTFIPTPVGDVITGYTFVQALAAISAQSLNSVNNRQLNFYPYNDTPIDDIKAYNAAHGTGYNPYIAAETNFPIINVPLFQLTDIALTYLPAAFQLGPSGMLNFHACTFQVGQTGTVNPSYVVGAITGQGSIDFTGGNVIVGSVPVLGNINGSGTQTFAEHHLQMADHLVASTPPLFNVSGIQLFMDTSSPFAGGALIVPALTYTDNGDNTETFLATAALWANFVIYSTAFRSFKRVITDIAIA